MPSAEGKPKGAGKGAPAHKKPAAASKRAAGEDKTQAKKRYKRDAPQTAEHMDVDEKKGPEEKSEHHSRKIPHNHKEQEELRRERKMQSNPSFELVVNLKKLWEKGRQKACPEDRRKEIVEEMLSMLEGKFREVIFHHDGARLVQFCFQHGNADQRTMIFNAILPDISELCQHTYSKFVVPKMLLYGNKEQRETIIKSFYGKVKKMMRHKTAADVLAVAFMDYANSQQRSALMEEFYGPEFALFKSKEKRTLEAILAEQSKERQEAILGHIKSAITPLLEKGRTSHQMVHRLLLDYITHGPEANVAEMLESIREQAVEMLHTREGARVALLSIWKGDAKARKTSLKSLKPYAVKIAKEEFGYVVLLGAFDSIDDTKLVRKSLVQPLLDEIDAVATDRYAQKVLLYLLTPRGTKICSPDVIALLKQGDGNPFSKKEAAVRQAELAEGVLDALHQMVARTAGALLKSSEPHVWIMLKEILTRPGDHLSGAVDAVAAAVAAEPALLDQSASHRVLKDLCHSDAGDYVFARALSRVLQGQLLGLARSNRSAFVVLGLVESCPDVAAAVRAELTDALPALSCVENAGTKLLVKALQGQAVPRRVPEKHVKAKEKTAAAIASQPLAQPAAAEPRHSASTPALESTPAPASAATPAVEKAALVAAGRKSRASKAAMDAVAAFDAQHEEEQRRGDGVLSGPPPAAVSVGSDSEDGEDEQSEQHEPPAAAPKTPARKTPARGRTPAKVQGEAATPATKTPPLATRLRSAQKRKEAP